MLWFPLAGELQPALLGRFDSGVLATLAHDAVVFLARLCLHPTRRKSAWTHPHGVQSDGDDAARRPVARRELVVSHLGRRAWRPVADPQIVVRGTVARRHSRLDRRPSARL